MYDARSEPKEFIADSRSEAIAKACAYFGASEEELSLRELDPTSVSGLAARAIVVARPAGAAAPAAERARARRGRGGRGREGGAPSAAEPAAQPRPTPAEEPKEPSEGRARGELGPVGEYVLGVLERMELGSFEIEELEEDEHTVFRLTGPGASALLGGEGRTLNALQLLANQAATRIDEQAKRVILDAEGDRANREAYLARVAERAAQRARESGRSVALEPMNGKDRRTAHMALRDVEGVASMSIGEGRYRQVLVVPEGAPEYEEARKVAEAAGGGAE